MGTIVDFINKITESGNLIENAKDAFIILKKDYDFSSVILKTKEDTTILLAGNENKPVKHSYKSNNFEITFVKNDEYCWSQKQIEELDSLVRIIDIQFDKYKLQVKATESLYIQVLTGLPNSSGYIRKLKEYDLEELKNYTAFMINLKNFGILNKAFNQKEGDNSIIKYSKHLVSFIHNKELISHFGGDNFAAIIEKERANDFIEHIQNFHISIDSNGKEVEVILSGVAGIYNIEDGIKEAADIISLPTMALQYAKVEKKNYVFLNDDLKIIINSAKQIEDVFDSELASGHFVPYYQPKVDLRTGKIIGSEALARWIKDDKIVPPAMFTPSLEVSGKIHKLDLYILECVCQDIDYCRKHGYNTVPVSCNLSRKDLLIEDIDKVILGIINTYNIKPNDIILEVTETSTLDEQESMLKFLEKMKVNGISTSIDDFGTGYSSLSALRDFKVSEIKIDRSFINRNKLVDSDEIIIGSIIEMARKLNIEVICEGVENETQAAFLERLGCYSAQGFLFDKPLNKDEYQKRLSSGKYNI